MNIHEYQAKAILRDFGVSVPLGKVALTPEEAVKVAEELGGSKWVVKAQIHAGGRGKGGGIKLVNSIDEVFAEASDMLGMTLVTPQTGPKGRRVGRIYIEERSIIARELYLSILVDRQASRVAVIVSTEGGMNIEEIAVSTPQKIFSLAIDPVSGIQPQHTRRLAFFLELDNNQIKVATELITSAYQAFVKTDASLLEINPLVITENSQMMALDVKMSFDDSALYRQSAVSLLRDESEEDPKEIRAARHGLNYIKLDGSIGCMVNGAGLAMATMDIIKLYGGQPANFLDVGGGATKERVTEAFKIILADDHIEGILVNIFGGIMRCDVIAEGIVAAAHEISLTVPLVVRLAGTNVDLGKKILFDSKLSILAADDLGEAAEKIVNSVKGLS